jgi:arylsulfatase A-like enzyme
MVSSYDFFPTLLDYLGLQAPADPRRVGRSYAEFLRGGSPARPTELYFEFGYTRAIRTENLKYVERGDGWWNELFDLEDDPGETINRVGKPEYRKQRLELRTRLHAFFDKHGAPPIDDWRSTTKQVLPTDTGYYTWKD